MFTLKSSVCSICQPNSSFDASSHQQAFSTSTKLQDITITNVEDILDEQMGRLTFQEKLKAEEEVHCLPNPIEETPEVVEESLFNFEEEIKNQKNFVYELAEKQNKAFLEDRDFRLMFLRADLFNVRAAACRLMKFLQQKLIYFGESKLTKDIEWSDLTKEDIEALESGRWHIHKCTDQSGRPIVFIMNHVRPRFAAESVVRASYFRCFALLQSVEAQKKGVVAIYYDSFGKKEPTPFDVVTKTWSFNLTCPIRYTATHLCFKQKHGLGWDMNLVLKIIPGDMLARTIIHYGSDMEIQYDLLRYGIPLHFFPVTLNGIIKQDIKNSWLDKFKGTGDLARLPVTSSISSVKVAMSISPKPMDFLLGRNQNNIGNLALRNAVRNNIDEYYVTDVHKRRRKVAAVIASTFRRDGARFLRLNDATSESWVEVNDTEAVKTIMQLFRSIRKAQLKSR